MLTRSILPNQAGCKAGAIGSKVSITLLSLIWE
jgi:hypothetical protein